MPIPESPPGTRAQFALAVRLDKYLFAIPLEAVVEVLPALPIEPLPNVPPFVQGAVFVRDQFLPVLDAAKRMGLPASKRSLEPPIVCLRIQEQWIGIEVDEALDLIELQPDRSHPTLEFPGNARFLSGFSECEGQIIGLLDPKKLLDGGAPRIDGEQNAV